MTYLRSEVAAVGVTRGPKGDPGDVSTAQMDTAIAAAIDDLKAGVDPAGDTLAELYAQIQARASFDSPAFTGSPTAPTPTIGDVSTRIATTAFVDSAMINVAAGKQPLDADLTALANNTTNGFWARTGAGAGAARTIVGVTDQILVTNGNGAGGNPTIGLPQNIAIEGVRMRPTPLTTNRGLDIFQQLPTSGILPGAIYSNLVQGVLDTVVNGAGGPGTPTGPNWSLFQIAASLGSNYDATGGLDVGQAYALAVGNVTNGPNTTDSDVVSISGGAFTNYDWHNARFYGGVHSAGAGPGGKTAFLIGCEFGVSIGNSTAGDNPIRAAINLINYGTFRAGTVDTACAIVGGAPGGEWGNGITFFKPPGVTTNALATTGRAIWGKDAQTVSDLFYFPVWDITGHIINTKNVLMTGAGILALGNTVATGGLALGGPSAANLPITWQHNGVSTYQIGALTGNLYIGAVGFGTPAIVVDSNNRPVIFGTNSNNAPLTGAVGEIIQVNVPFASAVPLASGIAQNVGSIVLQPGDYDLWGNVCFKADAGTVTNVTTAWMDPTSATQPPPPNDGAFSQWVGAVTGFAPALNAGSRRITLASALTIYLGTTASFSGGNLAAYGYMAARRRR